MKNIRDTVNKESFGHQSIATAWAADDGKPKPPKDGCSEEEKEEYYKALSEWALRDSVRIAELESMNKKHDSLTKNRISVSMEYAQSRREVQTAKQQIRDAKLAIDKLLLELNSSKERLYKTDEKGKKLLTKRRKIDEEKAEITKRIAVLRSEL